MSNCHVLLGDRVWQQIFRIPMGFACSQLWVDSNMQQDTWMTYVGLMWGIQIIFSTHIILG